MDDSQKTIEELKNVIVSLTIRLKRIEDYLKDMPAIEDYLAGDDLETEIDYDPLFEDAKKAVQGSDAVSASFLQRKLDTSFVRATRLLDLLQQHNVVAPGIGSRPRKVIKRA